MNKANPTTLFLMSLVIASSGAIAGNGNGDSPNGKPFVTINDQIIEVQGAITTLEDQIDMIVGQVDTLEGRVAANETAIATVESANASLQTLVNQNLSDVASIQSQVSALEAENDTLQTMINENGGDIETLETQVASNSQLISGLQQALLGVEEGYISLGEGLQDQIDDNTGLIATLQDDIDTINDALEFQQNLASGICPNGTAVVDVQADGSYVCAAAGSGSGGTSVNLQTTTVTGPALFLPSGQYGGQDATCPSGYVATGAGHYSAYRNIDVVRSRTYSGNTQSSISEASVYFYNNNAFQVRVHAVATCTRPY